MDGRCGRGVLVVARPQGAAGESTESRGKCGVRIRFGNVDVDASFAGGGATCACDAWVAVVPDAGANELRRADLRDRVRAGRAATFGIRERPKFGRSGGGGDALHHRTDAGTPAEVGQDG